MNGDTSKFDASKSDALNRSAASAALSDLSARHHDVTLDVVITSSGHLVLSRIVVPAELRNQGAGTAVMTELCALADQFGLPMALSPSEDFGGTRSGLDRFYRHFGFTPNRGPRRDLTISETMIRPSKMT